MTWTGQAGCLAVESAQVHWHAHAAGGRRAGHGPPDHHRQGRVRITSCKGWYIAEASIITSIIVSCDIDIISDSLKYTST